MDRACNHDCAAIKFYQIYIDVYPEPFLISPFLKELLLFQANVHDYKNIKYFKENG